MEWHISEVQSLAIIDQEISETTFAPAEYEILRRIIHETADFEGRKGSAVVAVAIVNGLVDLA